MNPQSPSLQQIFDADIIREYALEEVHRYFENQVYDPQSNAEICNSVSQAILSRIAPGGKTNFKFVAHCMISPRDTSGYDTFSNNYWNNNTDGMTVVDFENNDLHFSITIWGLSTIDSNRSNKPI